jgi:hypothetical protein
MSTGTPAAQTGERSPVVYFRSNPGVSHGATGTRTGIT